MRNMNEINTMEKINERKAKMKMVDKAVEKNRKKIIEAIIDAQIEYAWFGVHQKYEQMILYYHLVDGEVTSVVSGQAISSVLYNDIKEGKLVEVFEFPSGYLSEICEEEIRDAIEDDDKKYTRDLTDKEKDGLDALDAYMLEAAEVYADIDIDYLYTLEFDLDFLDIEED